ncbi:putative integral membrane protein [Babesia bovis T2Bo]|uniref:Membrane protein, putative n=1 Tax=Babesia bovis TaxID=5865 RepID=A7AQB6_BABBO|nr:putative integral membrane protein [Babesia bovis T2Bo]EDO08750.1 putative integral membrane protein [Babesia bovis T2Bo]|eukprot:XP_001612318.1 membrane protein [Babesia bovis T2Bo]
MMDTSTCTTIVLVLLWLSLWLQALGFLVSLLREYSTSPVLPSTTTLSTVLLGICLWQCKKAGYLVSPMTWYHWVLLVLLVVLQIVAVVLEQRELQEFNLFEFLLGDSLYPIYGITGVLVAILGILGGTLFCGWKCNLFCRPCCKSQYICYGSAIVVVLVVLIVLAMTAALLRYDTRTYGAEGRIDLLIISHLDKTLVPITQCYTMAVIWNTIMKLPYTVPEVVTLLTFAMAVASLVAVMASTKGSNRKQIKAAGYSLLAVHLLALGITWYCLEYKRVFYWPKQYLCFGVLAVVLLITLVAIVVTYSGELDDGHVQYTLIGYSLLLMIPTLWYAYRCGLLTWCLPKKKGLKATDTAENTTPDTDIAEE